MKLTPESGLRLLSRSSSSDSCFYSSLSTVSVWDLSLSWATRGLSLPYLPPSRDTPPLSRWTASSRST